MLLSDCLQQEFGNRSVVLNADNLLQLVTLLHAHALVKNNSLQVRLFPLILFVIQDEPLIA